MAKAPHLDLSRRERQIMLIIYEHGPSSASEVMARLPDAPSYSAVRTMLRLLEDKGHLTHVEDGPRYVYKTTEPRDQASAGALRQIVKTFFDNSTEQAMAALLSLDAPDLSKDALDRLQQLIDNARKEGR